MRTTRVLMFVMCAAVIGAPAGDAGAAEPGAVNASTVTLPCVPVGTYWNGPLPPEGTPAAPDLAVVAFNARPKDARVHLDGRFVGRARYLDGSPGYLYLEPGSYRIDLRLEGYESVTVAIEAKQGCRYDLKHRLQKGRSAPDEPDDASFGKGKPAERVYAPVAGDAAPAVVEFRGGPDLRLRPDLAGETAAGASAAIPAAALRLQVKPSSAAVWIDGAFVASGRELERMEAPLAVVAGSHLITVEAPGHRAETRRIEVAPDQVLELEIVLAEEAEGASL